MPSVSGTAVILRPRTRVGTELLVALPAESAIPATDIVMDHRPVADLRVRHARTELDDLAARLVSGAILCVDLCCRRPVGVEVTAAHA
jgi:hypothetical protein